MFSTLRQTDGAFPVMLLATITCLAVMFWRVTLLVLLAVLVTVLAYGAYALYALAG
jgi:hypothetical protein